MYFFFGFRRHVGPGPATDQETPCGGQHPRPHQGPLGRHEGFQPQQAAVPGVWGSPGFILQFGRIECRFLGFGEETDFFALSKIGIGHNLHILVFSVYDPQWTGGRVKVA